jgi:hypothetical protein
MANATTCVGCEEYRIQLAERDRTIEGLVRRLEFAQMMVADDVYSRRAQLKIKVAELGAERDAARAEVARLRGGVTDEFAERMRLIKERFTKEDWDDLYVYAMKRSDEILCRAGLKSEEE